MTTGWLEYSHRRPVHFNDEVARLAPAGYGKQPLAWSRPATPFMSSQRQLQGGVFRAATDAEGSKAEAGGSWAERVGAGTR